MNLAVNNLLSRDEDDGDDDENPEYLPGGMVHPFTPVFLSMQVQIRALVLLHMFVLIPF